MVDLGEIVVPDHFDPQQSCLVDQMVPRTSLGPDVHKLQVEMRERMRPPAPRLIADTARQECDDDAVSAADSAETVPLLTPAASRQLLCMSLELGETLIPPFQVVPVTA